MIRKANAEWKGSLKEGSGVVSTESGALKAVPYNFVSRFESGDQTNPEELIAAAHSGCFSMALANMLSEAGFVPESVATTASAELSKGDDGFAIRKIHLDVVGKVPNISEADFLSHAENAKAGCPISKSLTAEITMTARLVN
ncbi:OsmC family protein [Kamptonema cortianum]|nr:OsmC family protein [Geitlerinema splendidum]MDK3162166.1 OsmC family protein [Kamptonema cortianum]